MGRVPVAPEIIDRIKRHIAASPVASAYCKKAVCFLLDHSNGLAKSVKLPTHRESDRNLRLEMDFGVHDMKSLRSLLRELGLTSVTVRSWASSPRNCGIGISVDGHPYGPFEEEIEYDRHAIEQVVLSAAGG